LLIEKRLTSLNNSWLIAPEHKEIRAATEDGWTLPSTTLKLVESPQLPLIPMLLEIKPAKLTEELGKLLDTLMFRDATIFGMLLPEDPFQLLLMLQPGQPTEMESFPTAELLLTTVSFWSEDLMLPGKLKTVGEPLGVRLDSSDSLVETPALFAHILPTLPYDCDRHQLSLSKLS
jgi:hypothetical protein